MPNQLLDAFDLWEYLVKQLGDILLDGGLVSQEQLGVAVVEQARLGRSLGRVLVDQGVLTEGQLVAALAAQIGMRFVDLGEIQVDGSALARVPGHVARRHTAIPIGYEDGKLLVAMADPANVFAIDDLKQVAGAGRGAPGCRRVGRPGAGVRAAAGPAACPSWSGSAPGRGTRARGRRPAGRRSMAYPGRSGRPRGTAGTAR